MSSRYPPSRFLHATVTVRDCLYVWGGRVDDGLPVLTSTVEKFSVASMKWEDPQNLLVSLPEGLFAMAIASDGESCYTFGGRTNSSDYTDTLYQVNPVTGECREIVAANPPPPPRWFSAMVYHDQKLIVYGGETAQRATDDLHVFDLKTSEYPTAV